MNNNPFFIFLLLFPSLVFSQTSSDSLFVNPNPFVKRTLVRSYLSNPDTTSLIILNTIGATAITVYTNTFKAAGGYQDSLIMDNFPDGIYFVLLKPKLRNPLTLKIVKTSVNIIPKADLFKNLKVYPNPIKNNLQVELNDFEAINVSMDLLNGLGEVVLSKINLDSQQEINLSDLSKGIYLLRVQYLETQRMFKVVKE